MVVLSTDRSGFGISLCGRSLNSPSTVQIASVSSRASSTYCPLATSTTLLSPRGVAWPETTFSVAAARRSRCLSLSGLGRSSTRAGALSGAFSGGAAVAVAGTAANSAAPMTTASVLFTNGSPGLGKRRPAPRRDHRFVLFGRRTVTLGRLTNHVHGVTRSSRRVLIGVSPRGRGAAAERVRTPGRCRPTEGPAAVGEAWPDAEDQHRSGEQHAANLYTASFLSAFSGCPIRAVCGQSGQGTRTRRNFPTRSVASAASG